MGKLSPPEEDADFGVFVDLATLFAVYLPYRDKSLLPEAGGVLDQSPGIMDSITALDRMVGWWVHNLERPDADDLPGIDGIG